MSAGIRIVYLLESMELFGGVKIVLQQANLLTDLGHTVTVACPGEEPTWFPLRAAFVQTRSLEADEIPPGDVIVGTFYTTLEKALHATKHRGSGQAVHLCQGFEGALSHNQAEHPAIEQAYRLPLPALTVSEHLADLVRTRFARPARRIPQPLDAAFSPRRPLREAPRSPARILVTGPYEFYLKGVPLALEVIRRLRNNGIACEVVRLSQWPLGDEERAQLEPKEFHHHLEPSEVPALVRSCDLLLAPSWPVEGFGLPVLEAFASGVPVVASDIPSFREFAAPAATLVPYDDTTSFFEAARTLLRDDERWRRQRDRGLEVAQAHHDSVVGPALAAAFEWTLGARL